MAKTADSAAFTLVFRNGLAERNRLPIEQVIRTLQEFQEMLREVGRQVQLRAGVPNPDGDFGIELLATEAGKVFRKGSLKANATATKDLENAKASLQLIYSNVRSYARPLGSLMNPENMVIARRMAKIGTLQREARTDLALVVKTGTGAPRTATLNEKAIVNLQTLNEPQMRVAGVTLFGKLRQLNDRSKTEDGRYFWGELLAENSEKWSLRFKSADVAQVLPLFRHQVVVSGDATYFGTKHPRLDVSSYAVDEQRDYLAAFDLLSKAGEDLFGDVDARDLLAEMRD